MPLPASPGHSTLEWVPHDHSAGAPERDHAVVAPEIARELNAPETAPVTGPEAFYSNALPEAVVDNEDEVAVKTTSFAALPPRRSFPYVKVAIAAVVFLVVVGIAVGTGVGVGLNRKGDTTRTTTSSSAPNDSVSLPFTQKHALADTSLAVIRSKDGDRRLFFQEQSGSIRQGYSKTNGPWSADVRYIGAPDAKNHTPIAAIEIPMDRLASSVTTSLRLTVFYVSANDTLACTQFYGGRWSDDFKSLLGFCDDLSRFTVAADSRYLSASVIKGETSAHVLLFYEPSHGGIMMLNGSLAMEIYTRSNSYVWQNSSSTLLEYARQRGVTLSVPFATSTDPGSDTGSPSYAFATVDEDGHLDDTTLHGLIEGNGTYSSFVSSVSYGGTDYFKVDPAAVQKSDLLLLNDTRSLRQFWVNGTTLAVADLDLLAPNLDFPFTRLAGLSEYNDTRYTIYHQLNESTLSEAEWDNNLGGWNSNEIVVGLTS